MSRYAPVTLEEIAKHGFDYAAFGHIHHPQELGERVRYCGFAEGRGFDETGEGGVFVVDIDAEGEMNVTRHILSETVYAIGELSVEGATEMAEIEAIVAAEAAKYRSSTYLRLSLTGVTCMDGEIDIGALRDIAQSSVKYAEIEDVTIALPDGAALERDVTLRGEFYRTLRPYLVSDNASERDKALRALRIGLAAIDGKKFTDGGR